MLEAVGPLQTLIEERERIQESMETPSPELQKDIDTLNRALTLVRGASRKLLDGHEPKLVRNAIFEILREAAGPVYYREITERLQERGVPVSGRNKHRTVAAHLSTDDRFVIAERGYWTLASRKRSEA